MEDSYVKLYRSQLSWRWFRDPAVAHLFVYILLRANFVDADWHDITIKRGQLVTSRFSLAEGTGLTERVVRRCLKALQKTGEIIVESDKKYSLITIVKYSEYQGVITESAQIRAKRGPSQDHNEATNKKIKESNNKEFPASTNSSSLKAPTSTVNKFASKSFSYEEHREHEQEKRLERYSEAISEILERR